MIVRDACAASPTAVRSQVPQSAIERPAHAVGRKVPMRANVASVGHLTIATDVSKDSPIVPRRATRQTAVSPEHASGPIVPTRGSVVNVGQQSLLDLRILIRCLTAHRTVAVASSREL